MFEWLATSRLKFQAVRDASLRRSIDDYGHVLCAADPLPDQDCGAPERLPMNAERRERLKAWSEMIDLITGQVSDLLWQREQIRMIGKMIDDSPMLLASDKPFLWEARRWYTAFAAMAVRRQSDRGDKYVSLMQLLADLREHNKCVTRELLAEQFHAAYPNNEEPTFERALVDVPWATWSDASGYLSRDRLDADMQRLEAESKAIYIFASATVAHTSKKAVGREFGITFNDLDAAIDHLEKLAMDYQALLTGRGSGTLIPTPQFDWHRQFRFAWTPSKESLP